MGSLLFGDIEKVLTHFSSKNAYMGNTPVWFFYVLTGPSEYDFFPSYGLQEYDII